MNSAFNDRNPFAEPGLGSPDPEEGSSEFSREQIEAARLILDGIEKYKSRHPLQEELLAVEESDIPQKIAGFSANMRFLGSDYDSSRCVQVNQFISQLYAAADPYYLLKLLQRNARKGLSSIIFRRVRDLWLINNLEAQEALKHLEKDFHHLTPENDVPRINELMPHEVEGFSYHRADFTRILVASDALEGLLERYNLTRWFELQENPARAVMERTEGRIDRANAEKLVAMPDAQARLRRMNIDFELKPQPFEGCSPTDIGRFFNKLKLYVDRLERTWKTQAPEAVVEEVGKILFFENGYFAPPFIYDHLPARLAALKPERSLKGKCASSELGVCMFGEADCGGRALAAELFLLQLSHRLEGDQKGMYRVYSHLNIKTGEGKPVSWGEMAAADKEFAPEDGEGWKSTGWIKMQRRRPDGTLLPIDPEDEPIPEREVHEMYKQSRLLWFFETTVSEDPLGKEISHVRLIVRILDETGAPQYFAIEANGDEPVQKWEPKNGGCYTKKSSSFQKFKSPPAGTGELLCLLGSEFKLDPDFQFSTRPQLNTPGGESMNLFRSTRVPPRPLERTTNPEPPKAPEALPVVDLTIGAADKPPSYQTEGKTRPTNATIAEEATERAKSGQWTKNLFEKLTRVPWHFGGLALGVCLAGTVIERCVDTMPVDVSTAPATGNPSAGVQRKDVERAEQILPFVVDGYDLKQAQLVDRLGLLMSSEEGARQLPQVLDMHQKKARHKIIYIVDLDPTPHQKNQKIQKVSIEGPTAGVITVEVGLNDDIKTIAPSFWLPLIRRATQLGGEVHVDVVGAGLEVPAVAASFAQLWNELRHGDALTSIKRISISVNGSPHLIESGFNENLKTNQAFDSHFNIDHYGRIVPIQEFAHTAWTSCEPVMDSLPTQVSNKRDTVWLYPVCGELKK